MSDQYKYVIAASDFTQNTFFRSSQVLQRWYRILRYHVYDLSSVSKTCNAQETCQFFRLEAISYSDIRML